MKSGDLDIIHGDSILIQTDSSSIQGNSQSIHGNSRRSKPPEWWEFEAATPINQRWKGLRAAGFVLFASGAVVVMYMSRPPTEQAEALLACVLYVLILDPFMLYYTAFSTPDIARYLVIWILSYTIYRKQL